MFDKYCNSLTEYSRFETRVVNIGSVPLGGNNPIRIQSMTTTDSMDTKGTVEQSIRMIEAGCEYVRITAPSINEAKNLKNIKDELKRRGYEAPIIADIHFTPNAAEVAARLIEKVRINPGNYIDKKKFQTTEYSESEYINEIDKIRTRFTPLVKICKEYGTAMRIGTNHGSLSDRIMSRYGDTPLGMVESALEFVRICEEFNYDNIVLSMKASNTQTMVQAYRLLIKQMIVEGMNYPIHLGVTEAGDGEDGRIKSSVGTGALLEDGIGDTIRVSLTEEPENEIPVAKALVDRYSKRANDKKIKPLLEIPKDPYSYARRETNETAGIGADNAPKVIADFSCFTEITVNDLTAIGYSYAQEIDKWQMSDMSADYIYLGSSTLNFNKPQSLKSIHDYSCWQLLTDKTESFPLYSLNEYLTAESKSFVQNFVEIFSHEIFSEDFQKIHGDANIVLVLKTDNQNTVADLRRGIFELIAMGNQVPVIIKKKYSNITQEQFTLYSSTDFGSLLIDGLGNGVMCSLNSNANSAESAFVNRTVFGFLQAARVRISKTEYIACPSCGRTLFNLVEVTNKIRNLTEHLKGVKIGIMGCIVNGPGEMADADYGYVGSGVGKITLYKGREIVRKNIPSEKAVDELINLLKEDGAWREKL
ncbi:MAG: (E)-4-hydroxy-3-methylbut-2-enyl-diphosphate synthase [Bacteroidetes bacterium]|nr:(E)-4-hydroxy-3-methylbut-2-enyl-diphosphate synthase [Bacteroidota bacterium]